MVENVNESSALIAPKRENAKQLLDLQFNPFKFKNILYQHSILCQTSLPYRKPKSTSWKKTSGNATLIMNAIDSQDLRRDLNSEMVNTGLPYGPKARLIMYYINMIAKTSKSNVLEVGNSMTDFVKRLELNNSGRNIKDIRSQLERFNTTAVQMIFNTDPTTHRKSFFIVEELYLDKSFQQVSLFDEAKNEKVRLHTGSIYIKLHQQYYESLIEHSVPLDERAVLVLKESCLAMDIYTWLANRLHRIPSERPLFLTWAAIKSQFGTEQRGMNNFKLDFRYALNKVLQVYQAAKIEEDKNKGFILRKSLPPIPKNFLQVRT